MTKLELLYCIIAYINSNAHETTINNLATDLNVSVEYIQKTIDTIRKNPILNCISEEDDELSIILGKYIDNEKLILPFFNNSEYEILKQADQKEVLSKKELFLIKDYSEKISMKVKELESDIQDAINDNCQITFTYTKNKEQKIKCYPIYIRTNSNDNFIYFYDSKNNQYRLDKISNLKIINENKNPNPIPLNENRKYAWGALFNPNEKSTHIKLEIVKDTNHLIYKIKNSLSYRETENTLANIEKTRIYEDDITGLNEFKRWVRTYGSSIKVLEPEGIRSDIKNSARNLLDIYEESKTWEIKPIKK